MASESRSPFRFREHLSGVKEKVKEKAIKHNITLFVHRNLTADGSDEDQSHSRFGFRQQMHRIKDVVKNKTHYQEIKDKIKDKIDEKLNQHENQTYPKGFYDQLFSPETENDVYLQTVVICLWAIALLVIIPTIIFVFLPGKKPAGQSRAPSRTINMIFFHVFLCELCYLIYVLLAMVNVAQEFRLVSFFCDIANYGMYVTIPIMQFALLFLSLERLSQNCGKSITWMRIFERDFLVQLILWAIWGVLIAVVLTVRLIRHQFSFNLVRDQVDRLAPPIIGNVLDGVVSRRHHCSIDGRLSSVFKTVIIVLFVVLIVKPIVVSLGFNLATCGCCRKGKRTGERPSERRTTVLVTLFLLFNFFFSFPFYFVSMFNSILTRIDATKDTFDLVLKICFALRLTNIIFECLAFFVFERNSWRYLSKCFYFLTCKKCEMFNIPFDDDYPVSKKPAVQANLDEIYRATEEENRPKANGNAAGRQSSRRQRSVERDNAGDDGGMRDDTKRSTRAEVHREEERQKLLPQTKLERKQTLSDEEPAEEGETTNDEDRPVPQDDPTEEEEEKAKTPPRPRRQTSRSKPAEPTANGTTERRRRRSERTTTEAKPNEPPAAPTRQRSARRRTEGERKKPTETSPSRSPARAAEPVQSDDAPARREHRRKPRETSQRRSLVTDAPKDTSTVPNGRPRPRSRSPVVVVSDAGSRRSVSPRPAEKEKKKKKKKRSKGGHQEKILKMSDDV